MKLMARNCIGKRGPYIISQLNESIRLHHLNIIFLCETKQSKKFIETVCRKLKFEDRWVVRKPSGKERTNASELEHRCAS